ncbi:MAG: hypothetical protein PHW03_05955 [Eubacteriales bacterium]|nr:hypothetical protein [Eubacteriales bacterium]
MYNIMKKLINSKNAQLNKSEITIAEYNNWALLTQPKLDAFLACDRITVAQYEELMGLFIK